MRMPNVIYAMGGVSADGYVVGPDGKFDWSMPDDELHRFHNEQTRALAGHLLGRRLYETMVYWETADNDPSDIVREFALIWQALPKVVFSRTLDSVEGANTTLARDHLRAELTSLQESVAWRRGGRRRRARCRGGPSGSDRRVQAVRPSGRGRRRHPVLPARSPCRHGTGRDAHVQLARRLPAIPRGRPMTLRRADCAPPGAIS
jgi:hypothetical protein